MNEVYWDKNLLKKFKRAYARALKDNAGNQGAVFTFDGNQFVISYAKYLIEYLKTRVTV